MRLAFALCLAGWLCGCAEPDLPRVHAAIWPEADRLFRGDLRWVGGDGAYSVDLGNDRILWLFGDSFIAPASGEGLSKMVRNSVAIQTGRDPSRAFMRFYWGTDKDDEAQSFVPEQGKRWYWPGPGIRLGSRLILFYGRVFQATPGQWGFQGDGWTAFGIDNPDAEPSAWSLQPMQTPLDSHGVDFGGAVLREGEWLYVYGSKGKFHDIYLARFPVQAALAGDLSGAWYWCGGQSGWSRDAAPEPVLRVGAPEYSVHYDVKLDRYVMAQSEGFGPTTLALREAPAPEGPWSRPHDVLRPPESFDPTAFVYAGKGHAELSGADLVLTYVPGSIDAAPATDGLYFPHFVRLRWQ